MEELTAEELKQHMDGGVEFLLLDVREEEEEQIARIEGAVRISLWELEDRVGEIEKWKSQTVVVHCHLGMRGAQACEVLMEKGFDSVRNLRGGIDAWADIDPGVARY